MMNDIQKEPRIIEFPKIADPRGNLTFLEGLRHIPFKIRRAYWIYDVPGGEVRDAHAFKKTEEVIISLSGSFDVLLDSGERKQVFTLSRSYYGLYVPSLFWRQLVHFSTNAVALVAASEPYAEDDYILNFEDFVKMRKHVQGHNDNP
jgi:oxalate decarboxylase/phosphoglucose isomerase-like protein (cupin superfamily)